MNDEEEIPDIGPLANPPWRTVVNGPKKGTQRVGDSKKWLEEVHAWAKKLAAEPRPKNDLDEEEGVTEPQ